MIKIRKTAGRQHRLTAGRIQLKGQEIFLFNPPQRKTF